ncbi:hypothetical protein SAMN06265182_1244 [Persephonella hydrogeniphila]|uniref:Uncharacterized protein n=1 Tax=Persephonella hydrogeniphila TaxID=198703 RepID=A0A285NFM5_9AQUI|nr:hypothetical protein [Persephonella hydrogeniphila]SNZ08270.1 hypothetical protein SAMN06265182_1244 [Persephonella hydrogeniphila]
MSKLRPSFNWAFKKFIQRKNPVVFQLKTGNSPKTVYSWAKEEGDFYYRKDPITKAVELLDVFKDETPELFQQVITEILRRYGYVPVKEEALKDEEDIHLSKLMKELHDVPQTEVEILEDGRITKEELIRYLNEIDEALTVLNQKRAIIRQKVVSLREKY